MKFKKTLFIITLFIGCSCQKEHPVVIYKSYTININYIYSSSLDETKLNYHGTLNYIYDSIIHYSLMINDSFLFYNYNNKHGSLNMITHIINNKNELDEFGLPTGTFAADIFPQFIGDSTYLSDKEKDTIGKSQIIKSIGDVTLLSNYTEKGSIVDGFIKFINSKEYVCFNKKTHIIYFEYTIGNFSINEIPFTQKELKKYTYPKEILSLNHHETIINNAKTQEQVKNSISYSDTISTIPNFKYFGTDNRLHESKNIHEKLTILEFWYISCAPCLKNMEY